MKKFIATLAVGAMMLVGAVQAAAYFEEGKLIRVVYDKAGGGVEVATDLLDISTWTSPTTGPTGVIVVGDGPLAWNLSEFPGKQLSDLYIEYYAISYPTKDMWTLGPYNGTQSSAARQFPSTNGEATNTRTYYKGFGTQKVVANQNHLSSYYKGFIGYGLTPGQYNTFLTTKYNLVRGSDLENASFIDQSLYFYDDPNNKHDGVIVAHIRTFADGHTEIRPVPVPATVLLLGSGLLGLIGIRRKNS